jgi:hypothetical protein
MKAYKVELLIIDHDRLGINGIIHELENVSYPNDCIYPSIMNIQERDIGEWSDEHPLNNRYTSEEEYSRLFS